ncbi:MAG: TlpA family protein disulfide reductase [Rikenella sp.]|nr:TlpA family protein disulfide reductase [Rikenella sp.]
MKSVFLFLLAVAMCLPAGASGRKTGGDKRVRQRPLPQLGGMTPASPEAVRQTEAFDFTLGRGWVEGQVALDSGAGRLVTLRVPDLTEASGTRAVSDYLDVEGRFRFEVDMPCPAKMFLQYGDGQVVCYLYPDDTLRMTFRSADFDPDSDSEYGSVRFGENRSGRASRHLFRFNKLRRETSRPATEEPTDMASWIAFLRGKDSADRTTLDRYVAAEHPSPEVEEILRRGIGNLYAGYTWLGYAFGKRTVRPEQVRELHRTVGFPMTDDRNFVDLPGYRYALYQTVLSYLYSDTSSVRTNREKLVAALDSIRAEYPASLSRDVMCLNIFVDVAGGNKTPELYARIYPLRERYIASPVVRRLVPSPEEVARTAEEKERGKNIYELELKEPERFIGEIFAPYRGTGKVLYVDVWATWCGPCRGEMPHSLKLHEELKGKPVEFIYICIDSEPAEWEKIKTALGIAESGKQVLLTADEGNILRHRMGFSGVPTYWVVDKEGRVRDAHIRGGARPSNPQARELLLKLAAE